MRRYNLVATFFLFGALAAPGFGQQESLLIGSGDLIQVDVMDTPEMEQQVRVTDDGTAPLAYVGSIHVAGQTPPTAAAMIQRALIAKKVMQRPEVTVRIQEYATQDVSVLGQVRTPGGYPYDETMTVFEAVSLAGGVTEKGSNTRISIRRLINGQMKEVDAKPTDTLKPGDQINVKPRRL